MTEVASATVALLPTFRGGAAAITQQLNPSLATAGTEGGKALGSSMLASVGKFAAPIAAVFGIRAVGQFLSRSTEAASDLVEAGGAVEAVFGSATGAVDAFAENADDKLGLSKLQALEASKGFGILAKSAGLVPSEAAEFSKTLTTLSSDLAAFSNTSPDQAIVALSAALRGEAEPIRAYGVLLDDFSLRQEALKQGLITTTKDALTPQQRVLAAYALVLEQTKTQQGNFAETSDQLAQTQKRNAAESENLRAEFGEKLLPVVTDLSRTFNKDLLPVLADAAPVLADVFSTAAPLIADTAQALIPLISSGLKVAKTVLPPMVTVLTSAVELFDDLPGPVKAGAVAIGLIVALRNPLTSFFTSALDHGKRFSEQMAVQTALAKAQGVELSTMGAVGATGIARITGAANVAKAAVLGIVGNPVVLALTAGVALITPIIGAWTQATADQEEAVRNLTGAIDENTGAIDAETVKSIAEALDADGALEDLELLGLKGSAAVQAIVAGGQDLSSLREKLQAVIDIDAKSPLFSGEKFRAAEAALAAIDKQSDALTLVLEATERKADVATEAIKELENAGVLAYQAGEDIVAGIARGLADKQGVAVDAVKGLAGAINAEFRYQMRMRSPSKVSQGWGHNIGDGLAIGIDDSRPSVMDAVRRLAPDSGPDFAAGAFASSSQAVSSTKTADRPIYMDGALFGVLRELANGEARIVVNAEVAKADKSRLGR